MKLIPFVCMSVCLCVCMFSLNVHALLGNLTYYIPLNAEFKGGQCYSIFNSVKATVRTVLAEKWRPVQNLDVKMTVFRMIESVNDNILT